MSRIPLTGGFTMMSEGEHVLKITAAEYKEDFGKVKVTMQNSRGQKHFENFTLFTKDGEMNDGACGAFSSMARTALRDSEAEDVDVKQLVGCYIKGKIAYRTYEDSQGNTKKATTKAEGTWWEEVSDEEIEAFESKKSSNSEKSAATKPRKSVDLNSLLGR